MASKRNIEMYQGEDRTITVTVYNSTGALQDLTGYDIRYEAATATPIVKDIDAGTITLGGSTGVFSFTITREDTSALTVSGTQRYDHECRIESASGAEAVVFRGKLILTEWVIDDMDEEAL